MRGVVDTSDSHVIPDRIELRACTFAEDDIVLCTLKCTRCNTGFFICHMLSSGHQAGTIESCGTNKPRCGTSIRKKEGNHYIL